MIRILETSSRKEINIEDLEWVLKVVQTPTVLNPAEIQIMIQQLHKLREAKYLTALRGNRMTDLSRNVSKETIAFMEVNCPSIFYIIKEIESWLGSDSDLFIRTIKYDEARFSSTSPKEDVYDQNLHFDAGKSNLFDWPFSIPQFFLNIGSTRFFRVYPVPLNQMITSMIERTNLPLEDIGALPTNKILSWHQRTFNENLEEVVIPNGALVIFDGRRFAHDAGKWPLKGDKINEPDAVLALDLKNHMSNQVQYDVNSSFLK